MAMWHPGYSDDAWNATVNGEAGHDNISEKSPLWPGTGMGSGVGSLGAVNELGKLVSPPSGVTTASGVMTGSSGGQIVTGGMNGGLGVIGNGNSGLGSVGGGGGGSALMSGQTAPQGIFQSWVSMVAEQMGHHDVHYPWVNGDMKMASDSLGSNSINKNHNTIEETNGLYTARSNGSTSGSPPTAATAVAAGLVNSCGQQLGSSASNMLVVPQPTLLSAKLPSMMSSSGLHGSPLMGGSGAAMGAHGAMGANVGAVAGGMINNNHVAARKYQCKMCPQMFASKADLQMHVQVHMREAKPYKCSQCSKAFANSSYLSQHTRIHLGIKPYRCEICQRKFTQLSHLQQHIRTHTGDKPYKCRHPGCSKAFSQLSNLQSHSRCHQTDKPYKCNSCYKCFTDETSLLEHIPKHKESKHLKTQICPYCGKSYTQETYLQKHMQKHADRSDKRMGMAGGGGGSVGVGGGLFGSQRLDNPYWPKDEFDTGLGSQQLVDPTRLHFGRDSLENHRMLTLDDHRTALGVGGAGNGVLPGAAIGGTGGAPSLSSASIYDTMSGVSKHAPPTSVSTHASSMPVASSAFTPIQSMVPGSLGSIQMAPTGPAAQRYFYDPTGFGSKSASPMQLDVKPTAASAAAVAAAAAANSSGFISLHQISNYAQQQQQQRSTDLLGIKEKMSTTAGHQQ